LYDVEFDYADVEHACKHVNVNTSVGPDNISPHFILHGGPALHHALHQLFNFCWRYGACPTDFKLSNILPIYKKAGAMNKATNYRPISITSVVIRLYERIMLPRLIAMAKPGAIHQLQAGFRSKHACYDHLYAIYHHLSHTLSQHAALPVAFLDIEKAYDSVWHDGLMYKLFHSGITGCAYRFIKSFLYGRQFRICSDGVHSAWFTSSAGVPQGAVLSPLLFILFINDIYDSVDNTAVNMYLFADDIAIVPVTSVHLTAQSRSTALRNSLLGLSAWARKWKVRFSPTKSAYVWFSRARSRTVHDAYQLCDFNLQEQVSYKYLGVIFDAKCCFKAQQQHALAKAKKASYVLTRVISKTYAPSPHLIHTLANAIMRPTVTYGIIFYTLNDTFIRHMNRILMRCYRHFARIPHNSHTLSVAVEFNAPTVDTLRDIELCRFMSRVSRLDAAHPSRVLYGQYESRTFSFHHPALQYPPIANMHASYTCLQKRYNTYNQHIAYGTKYRVTAVNQSVIINASALGALHLLPHRQQLDKLHRFDLLTRFTDSERGACGMARYNQQLPYYMNYELPSYLHHDYTFDVNVCRLRCRLRMNRARTNVYMQHIDSTIEPYCAHCHHPQLDTVQHILLECPAYLRERRACESATFRATGLPLSLSLLLAFVDHCPTRIQQAVLRATAIYLQHVLSSRNI